MARASQSQKTGARRGAGGRIAAGKTAAGEGEAGRKNVFFRKKKRVRGPEVTRLCRFRGAEVTRLRKLGERR